MCQKRRGFPPKRREIEMLKLSIKVLALAAVIVFATSLWAQAKPDQVKVVLKAFKVARTADKESLVSADTAKPGDVIEYQAVFSNLDKAAPAKDVKGVVPVPSGLEYLPGTVQPKDAEATVDGSTYAPVPLKRQVKTADGKTVEQLVPYSEYKFLRWNLGEISAGTSKTVSARMKVKNGK